MCHATVTAILSCCFAVKDSQDSTGHEVLASSPTQVATEARDSALTRDSSLNQHALARDQEFALREPAHDKTFAPSRLARDHALPRDQALVTSALARDPSESDSDDDAVVIGRSVKSRTENQKHNKPVERSQRTSGVNKKDPRGNTKKSRGKKKAAKKDSAKEEDGDGEKSNMEEGMLAQGRLVNGDLSLLYPATYS